MLGVQTAELLCNTKAIGLVAVLLLCVAHPWWLQAVTWLRTIPRFNL